MASLEQEKHESARLLEEQEPDSRRTSTIIEGDPADRAMFSSAASNPPPGSKWQDAGSLLRVRTISYFVFRSLVWLLPSFIGDSLLPGKHLSISAKARPTAFLDGMRGFAAWCVFNTHISAVLSKGSGAAWGHDGHNYDVFRLPIVRFIYSGQGAVRLFFVISGFALSLGPVMKMNKLHLDESSAFRSLCSSTFRRPLRLFIPSFVATIPVFLLVRWGFFAAVRALIVDDSIVPGWEYLDKYPARAPTLWAQLNDLHKNNIILLQIFNDSTGTFKNQYNPVLWTIALEWRASLMLFLAHAALYYVRRPSRICLISLLIWISVVCKSMEMPLFFAGFLLAELWALPGSGIRLGDSSSDEASALRRHRLLQVLFWILFPIAGYFASVPGWQMSHVPVYAWLSHWAPFGYIVADFWTSFGVILLVGTTGQLSPINAFFSSSVVRYIGKISFSLYLVHLVIVRTVGRLIFYYIWGATGKDNAVITFLGFCVAYSLTLSLVIWAADLFWRLVENPTVDFAKWVETKLFRSS